MLGSRLPYVSEGVLLDLLDAAASGGSLEPLELQRVRKDGSPIFLRVARSLLHDHRGRLVGHVCVSEDVTEKKHIEEDRLRLARLESLGVMAGGIAHDFNNLLMGVLGNVSLARGETDPDKLEELLSGVQRASEKAVSLTNQLLTFAKGGAPAKELAVLNDLVADVVGFTLSGSPVRVDYLLSETWPVEVDLGQIGQVIQNLIINAKEAIPAEQGTIVVSTKDRTEANGDEYVEIAVSNTGPPIPARIRERIFDPYFSTKKAGSGLGLAVAHSVVTRHGGRIEVESAKASGTTFRVLLPARPGVTEDKDALALPIEHKETSLQVLVIDDEEMVRKILSRMLSILGHESVLASSGDEAVKIAQAAHEAGQHFELAIMDLTMPGSLGGVQATAALHKIDPALQVIVSSGYSDDPAIAEYGKYGFAAAIQKPYTLDSLKATLERVV
jgi:signal transduction histidine kinase/CheY-like chemotaxis protein